MKNEIIDTYNKTGSLRETAKILGISSQKVRKELISVGLYETDKSSTIQDLYKNGLTIEEIANKMKITEKAVNSYLPYTKGSYKQENPSKNALILRKLREKFS